MRLSYKIIIPFVFVIVFSIFFIGIFSFRFIKNALLEEEFLRFNSVILSFNKTLDASHFVDPFSPLAQQKFEEFAKQIFNPAIARFTIWSRDQVVLYSDLKSVIDYHSPDHQDLIRLFDTQKAFFLEKDKDVNKPKQSDVGDFMNVYIPIKLEGKLVGAVEAHLAVDSLLAPVNNQFKAIFFILVGSGFLMLAAIFIIINIFVIRPIAQLKEASREIQLGNFDYQISPSSSDEIGNLVLAFGEMARKLKDSFSTLGKKATELRETIGLIEKQKRYLEDSQKAVINVLEDSKALEAVLKEERDRSQAIIFSIAEGLFVVDKNFKIILTNPAAEDFFEVSFNEVVGKDVREVFKIFKEQGEVLGDKENPLAKAISSGASVIIKLEDNLYFRTKIGKSFPVIMSVAPFRGDGIVGAVVVFINATEEKKLSDAKTGFISVASHQLRTPLTSIRWFSEMLIGGDAGPINEKQKIFMDYIYKGTERMISLVNLLLQIARVEMGRLKIKVTRVDLKAFTIKVILALKPIFDEKSQKVEIKSEPDLLPLILLDEDVIYQVVQNLLSNANRYSPAKSTIYVSIVAKDGFIEYSVKDHGIGIPKAQQGKIFEKFFRANNALKAVPEGTGLGLSLVKFLVEELRGKIWFESEEGKGSIFYFTIPIQGMKSKAGEVKLTV